MKALRQAYLLIGLSIGFFCAGWYAGRTATGSDGSSANSATNTPDSRSTSTAGGPRPVPGVAPGFKLDGDLSGAARAGDVTTKASGALNLTPSHRRMAAFVQFLEQMRPEDAKAIIAAFDGQDRKGKNFPGEWTAFIQRWGELDGPAAAGHAIPHLPNGGFAPNAIKNTFTGWARKSPDEAVAFINNNKSLNEGTGFTNAAIGLITGVAETDPAKAAQIAMKTIEAADSRSLRSAAMETIADGAVRLGGKEQLLEVFNGLDDNAWKNAAAGHVWWRLKHSDPQIASDWLVENASQEWRNEQQYNETITGLSKNDPRAALEWASRLPAGLAQNAAIESWQKWTASDRPAAEQWLSTQPESFRTRLTSGR